MALQSSRFVKMYYSSVETLSKLTYFKRFTSLFMSWWIWQRCRNSSSFVVNRLEISTTNWIKGWNLIRNMNDIKPDVSWVSFWSWLPWKLRIETHIRLTLSIGWRIGPPTKAAWVSEERHISSTGDSNIHSSKQISDLVAKLQVVAVDRPILRSGPAKEQYKRYSTFPSLLEMALLASFVTPRTFSHYGFSYSISVKFEVRRCH